MGFLKNLQQVISSSDQKCINDISPGALIFPNTVSFRNQNGKDTCK